MSRTLETTPTPSDWKADCQEMSAGELRTKYPGEYGSWKNMKSRCKQGLGLLHPDFADFRSFLANVGPRPSNGRTSLDRRDNLNRMYGPGLVRWSDDKTQANNRSSTIKIAVDGVERPITELANQIGVKPDTLRKRRRRGWTDEDIAVASSAAVATEKQWPGNQDAARIAAFERAYLSRPNSSEGETRADYYIGYALMQIGKRRLFMAGSQAMLAYLTDRSLPDGQSQTDMEMRWVEDFNEISVDDLRANIDADMAFIESAEAYIVEARALRGTSKHSRPKP